MSDKIKSILGMQLLVLIYSMTGSLSKFASNFMAQYGLISWQVIITLGGIVGVLGIYAIFWQRVLKNIDLSIAYANKGVGILWTLVWSVVLFGESISMYNVLGIVVICAGVIVVTSHE